MKVLIFGGNGMLGHKIYQVFEKKLETYCTLRRNYSKYGSLNLFDEKRVFENINVQDFSKVSNCLRELLPDIVINAVGVIKQKSNSRDVVNNLEINSIFPHKVAQITREIGARFITFGTDCIFDGKKGNYKEKDSPNSTDLYGQSKFWGEVSEKNCLTLRTSIIGREIESKRSLVEWFLNNRGGTVRGFSNAIYSGFPTIIIAEILLDIIENHQKLEGVYHLSSDPINKFDLLNLINTKQKLGIEIERFEDLRIDRSLDSTKFRRETKYISDNWETLIEKMFNDPTPYENWRKKNKNNSKEIKKI